MSPTISVRQVEDAADTASLMQYLRDNEPATTPMLAEVQLIGLGRGRGRAWIATEQGSVDAPPRTVGMVCFSRQCIDMWVSGVHVIEPAAAEELAPIIDRGWTWAVHGPRSTMELLRPHLRRVRATVTMPWIVFESPISIVDGTDVRARLATTRDLDGLVALYAQYELPVAATIWQTRRLLRRSVEREMVIVCEVDGRLAAAMRMSNSTGAYRAASRLTVLPEHRRLGLSWAMISLAQRLLNEEHVGATVALAPSNPIDFSTRTTFEDAEWQTVQLHEPIRFRGHGRLRRLAHRILPTDARATDYWQERPSSPRPDPGRDTGSG